ncbi:CpsD/CapB family tyrosine-protein kinase [Paenirhodobacter populi]|uniref:Tyrosine-protein kinase family protein n=1 Tax=Paenirhodobacter populi TaxID=2306993 RepID=A0A443INY4_9RHOB|nr:CpsD/CapB family tyrosine-protein kinase [Sinirhodobacter populi]RWR08126.1 tyrosine-protein kinase family protein [Sinirhodobacter populi]
MEKLQIAIEKARASRLAQRGLTIDVEESVSVAAPTEQRAEAWSALPEMTLDPALLEKNRVIAYHDGPHSAYYDVLRTRLRDETKRRGIKRIAITSTGPGAGKSTTLANVSLAFARMPHFRTMIFDFDLRRPSLARILGQSPQHDMGEVLRGEVRFEDLALRYGENVAYGLNREAVRNSSELLQSEQTHDFLNAVEEVYQPDLMLFDMPPFLAADDTQGFLGFIDGVLMIVEAERTSRHQFDTVEQKLSELTAVVGVVLNKCPFPDDSDAGSYGYSYY